MVPVSIFISKNYSGVALCSPGAHPCGGRAWGLRGGRAGEGGYKERGREIDAENEKKEKKKKKKAEER